MILPMSPHPGETASRQEAGHDGDLWVRPSLHPRPVGPARAKTEPTVLLVGAREALLIPLTEAMARHGVGVQTCSVAAAS
jgi:hypothetical protein